MSWWRWRERNLIIDSSHWSKFLVFFSPSGGGGESARFTCLHRQAVYAAETESEEEAFQAIRDFKSLKKKVLPLGVNPTRCLSTQPGGEPYVSGVCFEKKPYISSTYIRCIQLRERWYLRYSHASALSHHFEKRRCKSFEAYRSTKNHQCLATNLATTNGTYQALCPTWTHLNHW